MVEAQTAPCRCGWAGLIGALFAAVLLAILIKWMTLPRLQQLDTTAECFLHEGACAAHWSGGALHLELGPLPLRCLAPLAVELSLMGPAPDEVSVDFQGVEFPEAFHRVVLHPASDGRYLGEAVLPLCARGGLRWQALVVMDDGRRRIRAPFPFVTVEG